MRKEFSIDLAFYMIVYTVFLMTFIPMADRILLLGVPNMPVIFNLFYRANHWAKDWLPLLLFAFLITWLVCAKTKRQLTPRTELYVKATLVSYLTLSMIVIGSYMIELLNRLNEKGL